MGSMGRARLRWVLFLVGLALGAVAALVVLRPDASACPVEVPARHRRSAADTARLAELDHVGRAWRDDAGHPVLWARTDEAPAYRQRSCAAGDRSP